MKRRSRPVHNSRVAGYLYVLGCVIAVGMIIFWAWPS